MLASSWTTTISARISTDSRIARSGEEGQTFSATLTDKISDRETFMKGIDYSYYYEQED